MNRTSFSALAALLLAATATPTLAGECPAGQARANPLTGAPTMPKGVTDTVVGSIDLGPEIGLSDHQLRTRRLVVQPGGVVPLHSHKDRPAVITTVSGTISEHSSTCAVPIVHKAGDTSREADGVSHYWTNDSDKPVELLSSDVHHGS